MPAPITHVVYAQRMLRHPRFRDLNTRAVIVGTNLPDARNAGTMQSRKVTHNDDVTLHEVLANEDPFALGFWFHSWLDVFHAEYFDTHADIDMFYGDRRIAMAWKTVEDELLADAMDNRDEIVLYFESVPEAALEYGVPGDDVEIWFRMLWDYFSHTTDSEAALRRLTALGIKSEHIAEILERAEGFRADLTFTQHVEAIIERFDEALEKS